MTRVQRLIPSETVGEYSSYTERNKQPLFPLEEEGEYGEVPRMPKPGKWTLPQKYAKREKKPKVYASYAVSSDCCLHGDIIGKYERPKPIWKPHPPRGARANSAPPTLAHNTGEDVSPRTRQASLPPRYITQEKLCSVDDLDMSGKLTISRQITFDIEDSLLDRSSDFDDAFEAEIKAKTQRIDESEDRRGGIAEGGELGLSTAILKDRRNNEDTFMHSTETYLKEDSMTTYVV